MTTSEWARGLRLLEPCILVAFMSLPQPALAQGVFVKGVEEAGGILRPRDNQCFVLTPHHAVKDAGRVDLVAPALRRAKGKPILDYPPDIAVVEVLEGGPSFCTPWSIPDDLDRIVKQATEGVLRRVGGTGDQSQMPVWIRSSNEQYIYIEPRLAGDDFIQGHSGSALYIEGSLAGLLLAEKDGAGEVYRVDALERVVSKFFESPGPQNQPEPLELPKQYSDCGQGTHTVFTNLTDRIMQVSLENTTACPKSDFYIGGHSVQHVALNHSRIFKSQRISANSNIRLRTNGTPGTGHSEYQFWLEKIAGKEVRSGEFTAHVWSSSTAPHVRRTEAGLHRHEIFRNRQTQRILAVVANRTDCERSRFYFTGVDSHPSGNENLNDYPVENNRTGTFIVFLNPGGTVAVGTTAGGKGVSTTRIWWAPM